MVSEWMSDGCRLDARWITIPWVHAGGLHRWSGPGHEGAAADQPEVEWFEVVSKMCFVKDAPSTSEDAKGRDVPCHR